MGARQPRDNSAKSLIKSSLLTSSYVRFWLGLLLALWGLWAGRFLGLSTNPQGLRAAERI
jgi:hypothetical protein